MAVADGKLPRRKNLNNTDTRVLRAFADERFDFRTVSGLAQELKLDENRVRDALKRLIKSEDIRLSPAPGPKGEELFTRKARPVSGRERLALAQAVVAKPLS